MTRSVNFRETHLHDHDYNIQKYFDPNICISGIIIPNGTFFFGPAPWGPVQGPKGQISLNIIKFQFLSQFQRFLNQTLCVFSQMKDMKHIRRDFHLAAWVMPQGWDLGVPFGVAESKKFVFQNSTRFGV